MEANKPFPKRSERIDKDRRSYKPLRVQFMFFGISWTVINAYPGLWTISHSLPVNVFFGILLVGLALYASEKFEKKVKLHPILKWTIAIVLHTTGLILYIINRS